MMMSKLIVLDTNILIRAILGKRVPHLLEKYRFNCNFVTPELCYQELSNHLPQILQKRDLPLETFSDAIEKLTKIVMPIAEEVYSENEDDAKKRVGERGLNDWQILALALSLNSPIWTEDQDFFGVGIATWNTRNIEIYLSNN
jgi:predicted nucleic acid-binding protein